MNQRLWRFAAALSVGALIAACGGGTGAPGTPGSQPNAPAGTTPSSPAAPTPGTPGETSGATTAGGISIGVQPVENTPIAHVAVQPAMFPSPAVTAPTLPAPPPFTRTWYVSPDGSDTADGSEGAPFQTLGKAITVAGPGERISVAAGTYAEDLDVGENAKAGQSGAPITIEGQGSPKLVPGGSGSSVVQISQPYWILDGFEIDVQKQPKFGVTFSGDTQGSVLANCDVHDGALGGGVTTSGSAHDVTIENNEIHHIWREDQDSHGVVIQPTSKNITLRNNDIHDNSADSIQCIGPEGFSDLPPADGVTIENNHLHGSRENAVDIKTCSNVTIRHNRMHDFHPSGYAPHEAIAVIHMSAKNVTFEGNELFDGGKGISLGGNHDGPVPSGVVIEKNLIHDIATAGNQDGTAIRIENSSGAKVLNNTFENVEGPALILGHGTGGATEDLTVENNVVDAPTALSLGGEAPGLKMDHNLYRAGAQFQVPGGDATLAAWQAQSQDTASKDVGTPVADPTAFTPDPAAVDQGADVGLAFCGNAPDEGAVETGC